MPDLSKIVSVSFSIAPHGYVESRQEQLRRQEESSKKENFSEILRSEACTIWEK